MKRIILSIMILASAIAWAQVPQAFKFQAVARDGNDKLLSSQLLGLRITIYDQYTNGTSLYSEKHLVSTNRFGLYSINIGQGDVLMGSFDSIPWGAGEKWLKIEFDPKGGSNYIDMGTHQLLSVPYALFAGGSGNTEAQELTLTGSTLSIKNGNAIDLTSFLDNTDNQTLNFDNSTGELSISDGNSVFISAKDTNYWKLAGDDIYYNKGKIGIGTKDPVEKLHVVDANANAFRASGIVSPGKKATLAIGDNLLQLRSKISGAGMFYTRNSGNQIFGIKVVNDSLVGGRESASLAYADIVTGNESFIDVHDDDIQSAVIENDNNMVGWSLNLSRGMVVYRNDTFSNSNNVFSVKTSSGGAGVPLFEILQNGDICARGGILEISGTAGKQGVLRLSEDSNNGTNFIEVKSPADLLYNYTITLPPVKGDSLDLLQTDGSGNLKYVSINKVSPWTTNGESIFLSDTNLSLGIGTNNPEPSAALQVSSTNKGFLPPNLTIGQRDSIPNPAQSLMIFNKTESCLEIYIGTKWQKIACDD